MPLIPNPAGLMKRVDDAELQDEMLLLRRVPELEARIQEIHRAVVGRA